MTDTLDNGYDRLLYDFGRQLDTAVLQARRAQRNRRGALAGGMALASLGAGAFLLIGGGGDTRLDLVAQARAALTPTGQIAHLITTTHLEDRGGNRPGFGPATVSEQWSASGPPRWRVATSVPTPAKTPGGKPVGNLDGLVTGPMQFSYGEGTGEAYYQRTNTLEITTGFSDAGSHAAPSGPLGVDPVVQVRALLDSGQLHDAGNARVDGRSVRRLVGEEPRGRELPWPVEYDVDPKTYAPVRVTIQGSPASRRPGTGIPTIVLDVLTYERLPLNARTEKLLRINTVGKPTVEHYRVSRSHSSPPSAHHDS